MTDAELDAAIRQAELDLALRATADTRKLTALKTLKKERAMIEHDPCWVATMAETTRRLRAKHLEEAARIVENEVTFENPFHGEIYNAAVRKAAAAIRAAKFEAEGDRFQ